MGNLVRHGVDMYKQTINLKKDEKTGDQDQGVTIERSRKLTVQTQKNPGEFLKTTKAPKDDKIGRAHV